MTAHVPSRQMAPPGSEGSGQAGARIRSFTVSMLQDFQGLAERFSLIGAAFTQVGGVKLVAPESQDAIRCLTARVNESQSSKAWDLWGESGASKAGRTRAPLQGAALGRKILTPGMARGNMSRAKGWSSRCKQSTTEHPRQQGSPQATDTAGAPDSEPGAHRPQSWHTPSSTAGRPASTWVAKTNRSHPANHKTCPNLGNSHLPVNPWRTCPHQAQQRCFVQNFRPAVPPPTALYNGSMPKLPLGSGLG